MSEPENFLERWSRRKREADDDSTTTAQPPETESERKPQPASSVAPPATPVEAEKPPDVSCLPSLDSITGDTDIRGFLQSGVPDELRHAALRRAWATDPQIRDFVGLVENGWDFNDPNAMHGFGPIEPSEVARLMGNFALTPAPKDEPPAPDPAEKASTVAHSSAPEAAADKPSDDGAASESETAVAQSGDCAAQNDCCGEPTALPDDKPV